MRSWTVKSTSDPKKHYSVTMLTEWDWQCTCPQFQHRHVECKHILGVRKAYDKQNSKSKPTANAGKKSKVQGHNRRPRQKRNPVPSGELRGGDSVNGNPAGTNPGIEPAGDSGHGSSSPNAETHVGTPTTSPNVPGPAEGSNPTPPGVSEEIRAADLERERAAAAEKKRLAEQEAWELRCTPESKELHQQLQFLRQQAKLHPEKIETLKIQAMPLKVAIRMANRKADPKVTIEVPKDQLLEDVVAALF